MLVSPPEGNKKHHGQSSDATTTECERQRNFAEFSMDMTNYCGVRLQLVKQMDRGRVQGIIMLNPESQIKILENNLNFLSKQNSSLKNVKCRSSSPSRFSDSSSVLQKPLPRHDTDIVKITENTVDSKCSNTCSSIRQCHCKGENQCGIPNEALTSTATCVNTKYNNSSSNNNVNAMRTLKNTVESKAPEKLPTSSAGVNKYKEGDNQYEFTLEQENIVSFVCSPSPPRKEISRRPINDQFDSDIESDVNFDHLSTSEEIKGKQLEIRVNNNPLANNKKRSKSALNKNNVKEQSEKNSSLLWHPPPIGQYTPLHHETNTLYNCCTLSNRCSSASSIKTVTSLRNTAHPDGIQKNKNKFNNSINQESVLFREASLRGCYNIENIIRDITPSQRDLEQKITKVRESIYSAIRVQKGNDDIVPDGIVAILNICKSWIKLNAHFERDEFKDVLETCGIDSSVLSEFLHWQCVSRTFIDKMVEALKKITYNSNHNYNNKSWNNNGSFNLSFQAFNINSRCTSVPGFEGENHFREHGSYNDASKNDITNSKHWKQRRFLLDQQKADKSKRLVKPKLIINSHTNNIPKNPASEPIKYFVGQGQNIPLYYSRDYCLGKNNSFLSTCSPLPPYSTGINAIVQSAFSTERNRNGSYYKSGTTNFNDSCFPQRDLNIDSQRPVNDLICCAPPILGMSHNPMSVQTPVGPPFYGPQFCLVNTEQPESNLGQALMSQNPILCIDTDMTDNCMKSSYMKPGNYNPPQKQHNCLRLSNNTVSIKEEQVTGFSFLYSSGSQSIPQDINNLNTATSSHKNACPDENHGDETEDSWRDALSSAKTVRDSLISTKIEIPDLKISETVSFKSNFLLSDTISQHSSSNELKIERECEEIDVLDTPSKESSIVDSHLKTAEWLFKSYSETGSENEQDSDKTVLPLDNLNNDMDSGTTKITDQDQNYEISSRKITFNNNSGNRYESTSYEDCHIPYENSAEFPQKKLKKGKRVRNDCMTYFEHPAMILHRKPKSIIKRAVTKHVSCKLEDILNCIWRVDISNLITDEKAIEQEKNRLELNVRSPLYLQAMKCKLSNHSYDTLEQALADFQQYFIDSRSRNKGDKQSMEAVTVLEQVFFDLVEKNFGLTKQHSSQITSPAGVKTRRPKKSIRRC